MEKADLYFLYDSAYSGMRKSILSGVSRDFLTNRDMAFICKYACEYYLRWGPKQIALKLNLQVLRMMKLDNLVKKIRFPSEISTPEKRTYLFTLMYPEILGPYHKEFFVIAFYRTVLSGERQKFPKSFFSGSQGADQNARICLMYALRTYAGCGTAAECIEFMTSPLASSFLMKAKLYHVMKRKYQTPLAYVRDAIVMTGLCQPDWLCPRFGGWPQEDCTDIVAYLIKAFDTCTNTG